MDGSELILTRPVSQPNLLDSLKGIENATDEQKKKIAKSFESILLKKVFDQVEASMGDWGVEESSVFKQIKGIFWMYLARTVEENGGLGVWKDIYASLQQMEQQNEAQNTVETLDGKV